MTKLFTSFDINSKQPKILSEDSERIADQNITIELAQQKLKEIGVEYTVEVFNIDDTIWTTELKIKDIFGFDLYIQPASPFNDRATTMGKGTSLKQALASMYMETIERISLWQHMANGNPIYKGLNLKTGEVENVAVDATSSERCAAGNTYEEATLHALHELIEKACIANTNGTANLKPFRVIDYNKMFPNFPDWIKSSFTVLQIPSIVPEFYCFIALRHPYESRFGNDWEYVKTEEGVWARQTKVYSGWRKNKMAYAFTAAGINPKKAISRCIQECFQGPERFKYDGDKKPTPPWLETVNALDLPNYETDNITDDIKFIVSKIPQRFNTWAIDFTSPEMGVPVVKVETDFHHPLNSGSKEIMNLFFNFNKDW